jgi:4-amino-4-deoxychorismate lyase
MCQFIDAIHYNNGEFKRIDYHQKRAEAAVKSCFPNAKNFSIKKYLHQLVLPKTGKYKLRICYTDSIQSYECIPYQKREINELILVDTEIESRNFKLADRTEYNYANTYISNISDILFVRKGLLTDTSYANIALLKNGVWYTPRTPLIFGVNRASLLDKGLLIAQDIPEKDIPQYEKIAIFNAMIEFGELFLPIHAIRR